MATPPHLTAQIAKARALVEERKAACKEQWSLEGCDWLSGIQRCWAYHQCCSLLRQAEAGLRALEAKVPERQSEAGGA